MIQQRKYLWPFFLLFFLLFMPLSYNCTYGYSYNFGYNFAQNEWNDEQSFDIEAGFDRQKYDSLSVVGSKQRLYFLYYFAIQSEPLYMYESLENYILAHLGLFGYAHSAEDRENIRLQYAFFKQDEFVPDNFADSIEATVGFKQETATSAENELLNTKIFGGVSIGSLQAFDIKKFINPWNFYLSRFNTVLFLSHSSIKDISAFVSNNNEDYWRLYFEYTW